MWIVEWKSQFIAGKWYDSYTAFDTKEKANTFMVKEIFDEPWYNYRVREIKEQS